MAGARTAAALVAVAAAVTAIILFLHGGSSLVEKRGLAIVTSFPNIADDVKLLVCSSDKVYTLAPPGSDPHTYQLTVKDYQLLRKADLVITTGHAPFEVELAGKVPRGKLLVIPDLLKELGGRILINPDTGRENLHMPIYDPYNYKLFIRHLANMLGNLNRACRPHYIAEAERITQLVDNITKKAPRLNMPAVASVPPVQYAVSWLGVRVVKLLVKEHGVSPTPTDIAAVESMLKQHKVNLVVVMVDGEGRPVTPADKKLLELAERYGLAVLRVPAPYLSGSTISKLERVVGEAERIEG